MPASTAQPPFVGRRSELAALVEHLDGALAGRGAVVLLVGDAGIGKTRLAEELSRAARARGVRVLWGRCHEGEGAPAFWPWVQLLRGYLRERDARASLAGLGTGACDISQILPEVGDLLGLPPTPPLLDPEHARFRLFDSITAWLLAIAHERTQSRSVGASGPTPPTVDAPDGAGLLLVLDDVHWADAPSLRLLEFVAREARSAPLLLVASYREEEVGRGHPLVRTIAELTREAAGGRVHLHGLSEADTARVLAAASGSQPDAALLHTVFQQTEGNPFFVTETARLLAAADGDARTPPGTPGTSSPLATGSPFAPADELGARPGDLLLFRVPASVREVITRRVDRLGEACVATLTLAAVMGREFSLPMLAAAGGALPSPDQLLEILEEAEEARVIVAAGGGPGRYAFSHALIRETLYSDLPASRRVLLHRQAGEALERLWAADIAPHVDELAHHFLQAAPAGDADRAVRYARAAADRALALYAHEEAVRYYRLALEALSLKPSEDAEIRCELTLDLADALNRSGDVPAARESYREAAAVARRLADTGHERAPSLFARAAIGYGEFPQIGPVGATQVALLEEALTLLEEEDSEERARAMGLLAEVSPVLGRRERKAALAEEAVAMARRLGDSATLGFTLNEQHWALYEPSNVEQRLAIADEMLELAERCGDHALALKGHRWRIIDLLEMGDIATMDAAIDAQARLAEELREPVFLWHAAKFRAMRALLAGDFARAETLIHDGLITGQRLRIPGVFHVGATQTFLLRREQDRLGELESILSAVAPRNASLAIYEPLFIWIDAARGRTDQARAALDRLGPDGFATHMLRINRLVSLTVLAEACALLDDARHARALYDLLRPYAHRNAVSTGGVITTGSIAYPLAVLAATVERAQRTGVGEEASPHAGSAASLAMPPTSLAELHFGEALAMNEAMGANPWVGYTLTGHAALLLERSGDAEARTTPSERETLRARAVTMLRRAQSIAAERGMVLLGKRIADLLGRERAAARAQSVPADAGLRSPAAVNLSPREIEVLRLLARGRTNREIADDLGMSVRTVERHVLNVYAKIGARGRAAATAFALRHHVL